MATVDHSDEQTLLDKITPFQKRDITSKNIFATTRISNIYDEPEGIRRMTMNTSNQIADISQHFEHYNVDNQRNASRFSDLCEVQIPQYEEELVSTENMNRQRFVPRINELPSSQVLKPPGKDIIYRGQKYIQFENGLKLSIYFLEVGFIKI